MFAQLSAAIVSTLRLSKHWRNRHPIGARSVQNWILPACLLLSIGLANCQAQQAGKPGKSDQELEQQVLQIIRDNPEVLLESVQAYQERQQAQQKEARSQFQNQLQNDPQAVIGDSPTLGAKSGKPLLIKFSDFQCPFCAKSNATIKQFMAEQNSQVTLVYKHLPLEAIHPEARPAAKAAWAAQQQGKFWEYSNALFENQEQLGDQLYVKIAQDIGLDLAQFNRDRTSTNADAAVQKDLDLAQSLGINSTPFLILNGQVVPPELGPNELAALLAQTQSPSSQSPRSPQ